MLLKTSGLMWKFTTNGRMPALRRQAVLVLTYLTKASAWERLLEILAILTQKLQTAGTMRRPTTS